jgi:hypothetical protein
LSSLTELMEGLQWSLMSITKEHKLDVHRKKGKHKGCNMKQNSNSCDQ